MKYFSQLLILIFILTGFSSWSQEIKKVRDIGIWSEIELNQKLNKNWELSLTQQARFFDNTSKLNKLVTDFGGNYKINKHFKLSANIRYVYDRKKDYTFSNDVRFNFDLEYAMKLNKSLRLEYRIRAQNSFVNLFTRYDEHEQKANLRNRIKIEHKLNAHSPYLSMELFRQFVLYRRPFFNDLRICIGDQIKAGKGQFDYAFCVEHELNDNHPLNFFFLKLNYTFKF